MQRISSSQPFPPALRGAVIALGNFDGFHLGHQAVVARAVAMAKSMGVPAIVATFDPHPVRHFRPDAPPFRLTTLDQRQRLFGDAGADAMLVLDFGAELASLHADAFIADMLMAQFGARAVVTGTDFVFGAGRSGNGDTLRAAALDHGFTYEQVAPIEDGGVPVSSSRIRDALRAGDCATATRLLTRPFAIAGVVEHGAKDGRKLGFPTANIDMGSYLRPAYGVYAVTGRLADGRVLGGAANLGIRPQFLPPREWLEPYFFDFSGDLYGQVIEVALHAYLRGEARFDSIDALREQIARDCALARETLSGLP
ncbi:MAG: bifunctional riboflavin kinase/FAD synthetase [Sphingopyxis sp.]